MEQLKTCPPSSDPPSTAPWDVVVIGGIVVDVIYKALDPATTAASMHKVSTPSTLLRRSLGGVGRNIAEALHRLGLRVALVSCVGDDAAGHAAVASVASLGIATDFVRVVPGASTATYTALLGSDGELAAAAADMAVFEGPGGGLAPSAVLTPAVRAALRRARAVVLEGNAPAETIEAVARAVRERTDNGGSARRHRCLLAFDPISVSKSARVAAVLGLFDLVKPNEHEVAAMAARQGVTGGALTPTRADDGKAPVEVPTDDLVATARGLLLATPGLGGVACTIGARGVIVASSCRPPAGTPQSNRASSVASGNEVVVRRLSAVRLGGPPVKVTGAGDTFLAAMVAGLLRGMGIDAAARAGCRASALSLMSTEAISPSLSPTVFIEKAKL